MHSEWLIYRIGELTTTVSAGFEGVHRRIDDQERTAREWRKHMMTQIRHIDRKKSGGFNTLLLMLYARILGVLLLLIAGMVGYASPERMRAVMPELISAVIQAAKSALGFG